jgi:hypothetical protein
MTKMETTSASRCIAALVFPLVAMTAGCAGGSVRAGIGTYEAGNYNRAAAHCDEMAEFEEDLNDKAHVRYLVYCGLTRYRLGDRAEAQRLLSQGNLEYSQGRSRWLKPAIVDEMMKALDDLEGRVPPVPQNPESAISGAREEHEEPEPL